MSEEAENPDWEALSKAAIASADSDFFRLAVARLSSYPFSERFWLILDPSRETGVVSFGTTTLARTLDNKEIITLNAIHGGGRMHRLGWLDLFRVATAQFNYTDDELASIGLSRRTGDAEES